MATRAAFSFCALIVFFLALAPPSDAAFCTSGGAQMEYWVRAATPEASGGAWVNPQTGVCMLVHGDGTATMIPKEVAKTHPECAIMWGMRQYDGTAATYTWLIDSFKEAEFKWGLVNGWVCHVHPPSHSKVW